MNRDKDSRQVVAFIADNGARAKQFAANGCAHGQGCAFTNEMFAVLRWF